MKHEPLNYTEQFIHVLDADFLSCQTQQQVCEFLSGN